MKINNLYMIFAIICIPSMNNTVLARILPRLIASQRNLTTHTGSYKDNPPLLVEHIHEDQAQDYRTAIQLIQKPAERIQLTDFLQERLIHAIQIRSYLDHIIYGPHKGFYHLQVKLQEMGDYERILLDPAYNKPLFQQQNMSSKLMIIARLYPLSVQKCVLESIRAHLLCKSDQLNEFERTLGVTFDTPSFEHRYGIKLERVSPAEENKRSTQLWQLCIKEAATGRNKDRTDIQFAIDLLRLESSRMLASEILRNSTNKDH